MTLALQNFVDKAGPAAAAAWMNELDQKRAAMSQPAGANGSILGLGQTKTKTAATGRNTNVVAADPDLQWTVEPGTYVLRAFLQIIGITTGTQGFQFNIGSTAGTGFGFIAAFGVVNSVAVSPFLQVGAGAGPVQFATIATGVADYVLFDSIIANNTTGVISVQWSARASGGNNAQVNPQSWGILTRIA